MTDDTILEENPFAYPADGDPEPPPVVPTTHDIPTLCQRLRGIYIVPINDGAGPLDGKDSFTQMVTTGPLHHQAAAVIEALQARVAKYEVALREIAIDRSAEYWCNECGVWVTTTDDGAYCSCCQLSIYPSDGEFHYMQLALAALADGATT